MEDLAKKFETEFPEFFRYVYCGFHMPARWEDLAWTLCRYIRGQMERKEVPLSSLRVAQVKDKFGGLRFYYDLDTDVEYLKGSIRGAVDLAQSLSFGIKS